MRKLMVRVFLGKCLLIFCNIFMVLTIDDHTTIWESESPPEFNITFFKERVVLRLEEEFRELSAPREIKRFVYDYNDDENCSISFIISSCKSAEIEWILKFIPENETSDEVVDYSLQPDTLAQYTGTEPHIYVGKARRGRYYLELFSTKRRQTYFVYVTKKPMFVELLRQYKEKSHRRITFKKSLSNTSLTIKWPEWSWKNEEIMYVLVWGRDKYITSACELEYYSLNSLYVTTKNKSYEWRDQYAILPGDTFYVSIFIKLNSRNDFLIPYLQGRATFPRSDPVVLRDGIFIRKNSTSDDDKLTFRYKVRNRQFPGSENEILWYVISCAATLQIEVNHRKDAVLKKQLVSRYKAFKISQPNIGNRYVLKVTNPNGTQNEGVQKNVEVFASMHSDLFPFPNVTDLDLKLLPNLNYNVRNKTSYKVEWHAASDKKQVHYCMRVYNKTNDEGDDLWQINQCTNMKKKFSSIGGFVFRNCTRSSDNSSITLPIYNLDPLSEYVVYVSARKQGFKRRLWYNILHVPKQSLS